MLDKVEDYSGRNIDDLKLYLQGLSTTTKVLVSIREPPLYIFDNSAPGTILDQTPKSGTEISGPTVLDLVVSKGPEAKDIPMPSLIGLSLREMASKAATTPLVFKYKMRAAHDKENPGTVVEQSVERIRRSSSWTQYKLQLLRPQPAKATLQGYLNIRCPNIPMSFR